jgi:hypothetical protein
MAQFNRIFSNRDFNPPVWWQIVHEWEDEIAQELNTPIFSNNYQEGNYDQATSRLEKLIKKTNINVWDFVDTKNYDFVMMINSPYPNKRICSKNKIVNVIDCWDRDFFTFQDAFKDTKHVFVSMLQAVGDLKKRYPHLNVSYLPISLPSKYIGLPPTEKTIDILQVGRINKVLHGFALQFVEEFPQFGYAFSKADKVSLINQKEELIRKSETRADYINCVRSAKIILLSTPGTDADRYTGGYNPITPRWLEAAAGGASIIGRYTINEEVDFFDIPKYVPHVDTYEQFKKAALAILVEGNTTQWDKNWLESHSTKARAHQIKEVISKL